MRNRRILTYAASVLAMLSLSAAALAGKQNSSLSLVVLSGDTARSAGTAAAGATYGGDITFDVATSQTDRPFVNVRCYQGDSFVYDAWHGFFDGYYTDPVFTLDSSYWPGGAASCTARLVDWAGNGARERTLATTSFAVSG